jgi:hypothetical protein
MQHPSGAIHHYYTALPPSPELFCVHARKMNEKRRKILSINSTFIPLLLFFAQDEYDSPSSSSLFPKKNFFISPERAREKLKIAIRFLFLFSFHPRRQLRKKIGFNARIGSEMFCVCARTLKY